MPGDVFAKKGSAMWFSSRNSGRQRHESADETLEMVARRIAQAWFPRWGEAFDDDGQAAMEFALCAPVVLLVVTGIITFGMTLSNYTALIEATNTAARQFAISRGQQNDPCAIAVSAMSAAAPSLVKANITTSFQVYTTTTTYSSYTTTCSGATLNAAQPVIMTTTYPCNLSWYGKVFSAAATCKLTAQTTEVLQ